MRAFWRGFTLAEILITLTIIGIIAALTVPTLQQKYTEHVTVNKVKKFYSTLQNAYAMAVRENGTPDTWGVNSETPESAQKIFEILIQPHFKIAKDCGHNNEGNCIAKVFKINLAGQVNTKYADMNRYYKVLLSDGSAIWFRGDINRYLDIFLDINGAKEPNTMGKDMFNFEQLFPKDANMSLDKLFDTSCTKQNSFGCATWVLYKGNQEYLHCDDLSWNGKQKCSK